MGCDLHACVKQCDAATNVVCKHIVAREHCGEAEGRHGTRIHGSLQRCVVHEGAATTYARTINNVTKFMIFFFVSS